MGSRRMPPTSDEQAFLHSELAKAFRKFPDELELAEFHCREFRRIIENAYGASSPEYATALNDLAELLRARGKYDEARPLYEQSLNVCEESLGPEHPHVAASLNNLAATLTALGDYAEAEPLFERAIAIDRKVYGPDHAEVAADYNNLAGLLEARGDDAGAEKHYERAVAIWGDENAHAATALNNLALLKWRAAAARPAKGTSVREKKGAARARGLKWEDALKLQKRAIAIAKAHDSPVLDQYHTELAQLEHKKPYPYPSSS